MKIVKHSFAVVLAIVMVFGMMVAPASAATGFDSFTYRQNAYSGYCSLTLEEHGATAVMDCSEGSGAVTTSPKCNFSGYVFAEDGNYSTFSASAEMARGEKYMSCTDSGNLGTKTSVRAYCYYYVNSGPVGDITIPKPN